MSSQKHRNTKNHNNKHLNNHLNMQIKEFDFDSFKEVCKKVALSFKWIILGIVMGLLVGTIGTGFYYGIRYATAFRLNHDLIILLLPVAGLLIVFLYHICGFNHDSGTNLVLDSISKGENIPLLKAPLIFISTVITHLFGGSSGRESAALQIGGSIGQNFGSLIRLDEDDKKMMTMCGMSAAFSSLFGTPMAAAFLALEIVNVGHLYYSALVPCVLASLAASELSKFFGTVPDSFNIKNMPSFNINNAFVAGILAILCALVSIFFCVFMHMIGKYFNTKIENDYLKIFAGGLIIVALTYASCTRMFNGAGMDVIEMAVNGKAPYLAFLVKLLFTAITLGSGFKGGEIVPSLYVGATFGCTFARLTGFSPALSSAVGMCALFCGVTNCPVASLLLCFEMFGYKGMPFYLIAISLSYVFSGYYSVYTSQKIVYSKFKNISIDRNTK